MGSAGVFLFYYIQEKPSPQQFELLSFGVFLAPWAEALAIFCCFTVALILTLRNTFHKSDGIIVSHTEVLIDGEGYVCLFVCASLILLIANCLSFCYDLVLTNMSFM